MNIGYKLVKNVMPATAEKAPYLGMAIPVGSLAYDNILKEMIKTGTKITQPTAKYFLDALYEFATEKIAAEVVRINIGTVSLYPAIDGSFDSDGGQRITCRLKQADKAIPKGVYKVRLASHGLDPTDPLTVATLTVTLLDDIPVAPPHYPATSKDGTTTVTGFRNNDGEEVVFITDGIVDFTGTGLGRITTNGEWRESSDAEWKQALIGMPPEEGEPLGFALEGHTEPGEYPNAEFKLPHPSGDMIVPFGYKHEE